MIKSSRKKRLKKIANDEEIIFNNDVDEEEFKTARAKLLEIKESADNLVETYMRLYEDFNNLYNQHPKLYQKLQQVVLLPTNEDAQNISEFSKSLNQELSYFKDDNYLKSILSDNFFEKQE